MKIWVVNCKVFARSVKSSLESELLSSQMLHAPSFTRHLPMFIVHTSAYPLKNQSSTHVETSQMICVVNQLTGFYVSGIKASVLIGLNFFSLANAEGITRFTKKFRLDVFSPEDSNEIVLS